MTVTRLTENGLPDPARASLTRLSLYSSPAFAAVWKAKGGAPVFWTYEQDGRVAAVLPGVEFGSRPLARFQAMPDGLPGRIAFLDCEPSEQDNIAKSLFTAVRNHGYARVYITDFYDDYGTGYDFKGEPQETGVVALTDEGWLPPDKTLQSEIRKADREGVVVQPFDRARHLAPFLALLRATEQRLGIKPRYPDAFYAALADVSTTDNRIVWTMVEHETNAVASHIYLLDADTALYWVSCLDKEYSSLKANQAMLYAQSKQFMASGISRLNLGQTPPDSDSLSTFKAKWGAKPYRYRCYTAQSLLGRIR